MEILILSKTHMNHGKCCVGGITDGGRYVRLLTPSGENQDENTTIAPRQIYDIRFKERSGNVAPHVEDVLVQSMKYTGDLNDDVEVLDFITQRQIPIWVGNPDILFDKKIQWTDSGSGYINKKAVPDHSVGFWIPDEDLTRKYFYKKFRYSYPSEIGWRSLPYVGFDEPVEQIPAGTLVRVSLARWWDTKGTTELRCSLQLSGWYDYSEE